MADAMTVCDFVMTPTHWITAWVRETRSRYGWTYTEMARRCGVNPRRLRSWEQGTRPQWRSYQKLFVLARRPYLVRVGTLPQDADS